MKLIFIFSLLILFSCKKKGCTDVDALNYNDKAKVDDGSCVYDQPLYTVPTTYSFTDKAGNNTVDFSESTTLISQLREIVNYMQTSDSSILDAAQLKSMFTNENGNANGAYSFYSTKQLKENCFLVDQTLFESYFDSIALVSLSYLDTAKYNVAGNLNLGSSIHLFSQNGIEYLELIKNGLLGAVFMNQALNHFLNEETVLNNSVSVDDSSGQYYTLMEHYFDQAFGFFGVDNNFPISLTEDFWGKYCNDLDVTLGSNKTMMDNFLKGRAAITYKIIEDRNVAIKEIKNMWEKIIAYKAMNSFQLAIDNYANEGNRLHYLSESYSFLLCLKYVPSNTRKISIAELNSQLQAFGINFWDISISSIQQMKSEIDLIY
jgi:hypothetical protein